MISMKNVSLTHLCPTFGLVYYFRKPECPKIVIGNHDDEVSILPEVKHFLILISRTYF